MYYRFFPVWYSFFTLVTPITIIPGSHEPRGYDPGPSVTDSTNLLLHSCSDVCTVGKTEVHASSFDYESLDNVHYSTSSFVRSAIEAWGRHAHLVIRPEDFWFTILVQINFYMEKHAEDLRHLFVSHKGKKDIEIWGNTWHEVMHQFAGQLHKRIKTDWLLEWVMPSFSTSTEVDRTTATVLMMGLMKGYFDYGGGITCGIPSITLLGTKDDWQQLLKKLDRIPDFGKEPTEYAKRLRPILRRIVDSFDSPASPETRNFWDQMVHAEIEHTNMCGAPPTEYYISGWIMGLFFWNDKGDTSNWFGKPAWERPHDDGALKLDGVSYRPCNLEYIPVGYAKAKFRILREGESMARGEGIKSWVLAGAVGKKITKGAPEGYEAALERAADAEEAAAQAAARTAQECKAMSASAHFRALFRSLDCFRGEQEKQSILARSNAHEDSREKCPAPSSDSSAGSVMEEKTKKLSELLPEFVRAEHRTIQPMSGWFLFGPEEEQVEVDPEDMVISFHSGGELFGPTVDAIESCPNITRTGTKEQEYVDWPDGSQDAPPPLDL